MVLVGLVLRTLVFLGFEACLSLTAYVVKAVYSLQAAEYLWLIITAVAFLAYGILTTLWLEDIHFLDGSKPR